MRQTAGQQHKKLWLLVLTAAAAVLIALVIWRRQGRKEYTASHYPEELTIDVYDEAGKIDGLQTGWFANEVHRRFNMNLNIIKPEQKDGTSMLDTMLAAGNLGDLVITSAEDSALQGMVGQGLLCDLTPYVKNKPSYARYRSAVDQLNEGLGGIYAYPSNISTKSWGEPSETFTPENCPYGRWDLYHRLGYPKVDSLEDLLLVLKRMQQLAREEYPGERIYALSFSSDQDDGIMHAAQEIAAVYGYRSQGVVMTGRNGESIQNILDSNSAYMKALSFLYEAHKKDLVDPESTTQSSADVLEKMREGRVLFTFDASLALQANTRSQMQDDMGFLPVFIGDCTPVSLGCSRIGSDTQVIAVGARTRDPRRLADFIDWLYSDEGVMAQQAGTAMAPGVEGMTWEMADGAPQLTSYGRAVLDNDSTIAVGDEWGGGSWQEGASQLGFNAVNLRESSVEGIPYAYRSWKSVVALQRSALEQDWSDFYQTDSVMGYLQDHDMLQVENGGYISMPQEGTETAVIRDGVSREILQDSWNMVFAQNDAVYEELQQQMGTVCAGLHYWQILRIDMSTARIAASWKRSIAR